MDTALWTVKYPILWEDHKWKLVLSTDMGKESIKMVQQHIALY